MSNFNPAQQFNILSYANTFGDWVVTTNALVKQNNDLAANNFTKASGTLYLSDPSLALQVNTASIFQSSVQIIGVGSSAYIQNNLTVGALGSTTSGQVYLNYVGNGPTLTSYGLISALGANTGLYVANTANIGGSLFVSNTASFSNTVTVYGTTYLANNLYSSNTIFVDKIQSNTSVNTKVLTAQNQVSTNFLQANSAISTYNLVSDNIQANTSVTSNSISAVNTLFTNSIQANGSINTTTSTSNTVQANVSVNTSIINVTGLANLGNVLTNIVTANNVAVGSGGLSVAGNFVINGSTVYNAPTFTISANSPNPSLIFNPGFGVYRSTANALIRWNESNTYWEMNNVNTGNYYRVLTNEYLSDSTSTNNSSNVASSAGLYVVSSMANSAFARANTSLNVITGTSGYASPNNGAIIINSGNGLTVYATANTLTVNTAQDLRTTANPSFNGLSLTNALPITSGGTGSTSASDARTAILPTGTTAGYVLTTGGPGNFYWSAPTGGGGGGVTPGTSINSTRITTTANASQTVFTTPTYIPGASQLRVYINGVRQFNSDYTETSNTSITLTSGATVGDIVLLEVDGYYVNPYYANNIPFTAPFGSIISSANTIQLAIQDLETRKATLTSPTFTGGVLAPTPATTSSNTQVATTAFVSNYVNQGTGTIFTHSISGNAGTVTNGVYTNGSYSNPTWFTALDSTKLTGTIPSAVLGNSSLYVGTTAIALNRATSSLALTGVSIDGTSKNITDYTINQNVGSSNSPTFSDLYVNGWFRNNNSSSGLYNQATTRGIVDASYNAPYGTMSCYGTGYNSWQGWSIPGTFSFMGQSGSAYGLYDSSSAHWSIYTPYNTSYMGLNGTTTSSSWSVYVSGSIYATGNIAAYSDRRKKKNIVTIDNALDKVLQLRGVYYERIDPVIESQRDKTEIGVIAQEVLEVTPEVVTYADDVDEYGVTYGNFAGLFIEAFKDQQKLIDELRKEIEDLKLKVN
jgi:hypothetical protein